MTPVRNLPDADYRLFFEDITKLCNKYRITFCISRLFELPVREVEGKLLDVAGFSTEEMEDGTVIVPFYIDTLS